jgi:hypothetical protein
MRDLYKIQNGKEVTVDEAVTEFLNSEIETFREKLDISQASEKSIGTMGFKLLSDDIQIVYGKNDLGNPFPILLVAIVKLDDKVYGAFYNPREKKRYAEEITINYALNITNSRLIEDQNEWLIVSNYFNLNNVFEKNRIVDWYIQHRNEQAKELQDVIRKMEWFKKAASHQKQKGQKELTPQEVINFMPKVSDVLGTKGLPGTQKPRYV